MQVTEKQVLFTTRIPKIDIAKMVLEELACLYRTYRTEYLKVVCGLLALTLGPWLGVQVNEKISHKKTAANVQTLNFPHKNNNNFSTLICT